ncbi:sensor histidine kinase [Flavobacterium qiangtangense]|uniref:histidine kinase n=1 Tax=Flavobacterium qiangtangense TaxID=1442595 RepID=A0ABW1PQG1_9FLAO
MQFSEKRNVTRWIIIVISFIIVTLILWNTYTFFQIFKKEERQKMEIWASSLKTLNMADLENDDIELPRQIMDKNTTIPIVLTDQNGTVMGMRNIADEIANDSIKSQEFFKHFKNENIPIKIEFLPGEFRYIYFGNSQLLNNLKYYPIALFLILLLFGLLIFNFYRASRMATQNKLWAGMAKETAHQIGTPLSSLLGWIEIMKTDDVDETTVTEIEKDIVRLQTIADRFSKIGSEPVLEQRDIIKETEESYDYLKSRFSKQIDFTFKAPQHPILVLVNPILHSWTVENLVKNAIDAMKGRGKLSIEIEEDAKFVKIKVKDSGKGIPKNQFKRIFEPGFTTKKRGWGLGLSLTKRIVEEYHDGKIKVYSSEINKGTCIIVSFNKK